MSDLSRYIAPPPSHARHSPQAAVQPGSGRSVDQSSWSGTVLGRDDMGLRPRDEAGDVVAEAVQNLRGVRRSGGHAYRRRLGWIAQVGGVLVATSDQPLAPRPDGRYAPTGPWAGPVVRWYALKGPPSTRRGDVPHDQTFGEGQVASGSTGSLKDGPMGSLGDADYLPMALRKGLLARVGKATLADAEAIQFTRPDGSTYHSVSALVLNDREGIVIRASRQQNAATWQAEQLSYTFISSGPALEGGSGGHRPQLV